MREATRDIDRLHHIDECIAHINDFLKVWQGTVLVTIHHLFYPDVEHAILRCTLYFHIFIGTKCFVIFVPTKAFFFMITIDF